MNDINRRAERRLQRYQLAKAKMAALIWERQHIYEEYGLPSAIDYDADKVQSTPDDHMPEMYERIQAKLAELDAEYIRCVTTMNMITSELKQLDNRNYFKVLWLLYIEDLDLQEVSDRMAYEYKYTSSLKGLALTAYDRIVNHHEQSRNEI